MEGSRRLLWAIIVVCAPKWVHSGFPSTFWTPLAHWTRKSTVGEMEESRMCALVHVILTCQLAHWQHNKGYHASFENPPAARSWPLDIVNDTMAAVGAKKYKTDSCSWGHVDPMSGRPVTTKNSSVWHPPPTYQVWSGDAAATQVQVGARQASMKLFAVPL